MAIPRAADQENLVNSAGILDASEPQPSEPQPLVDGAEPVWVTLTSGRQLDIAPLDAQALQDLQWCEERGYAALIASSAPGSQGRRELFRQGYDTVTTIQSQMLDRQGRGLVMGYDRRYAGLVRQLLARRAATGRRPRVFEIGYGSGALLASLGEVDVAGIEVSETMRRQACRRLPAACHERLHLGDFLTHDLAAENGCDLVFWNDVLEHLVPDDVPEFLRRIHSLLAPGGYLVTITPNWHMRPSDITADYHAPRTTAIGFHLKEYTLGEVTSLLRAAGFSRVATPLVITKRRMIVCGSGLAGVKRAIEPALEWLPYRAAKLACRGMGLSCTIAVK